VSIRLHSKTEDGQRADYELSPNLSRAQCHDDKLWTGAEPWALDRGQVEKTWKRSMICETSPGATVRSEVATRS